VVVVISIMISQTSINDKGSRARDEPGT